MTRRKKVISTTTRQQVITRDNGRCRACGIADRDALQCDHIVPESKGGTDSLDNLQALCGVCNNRKGRTDVGELAILPPVEGFGDYNEVMEARTAFLELVSDARQQEISTIQDLVAQWKAASVRKLTIRKRLEKMMPARQVEKFL